MSPIDAVDPSDIEDLLAFPATGLELKRAAEGNRGWYGDRLLLGEERLSDARGPHGDPSGPRDATISPPSSPDLKENGQDRAAIFVKMAPSRYIKDVFARAVPPDVTGPSPKRTAVTVVTAGPCDQLGFKRSAAALAVLQSGGDDCHLVEWRVQVRDSVQQRTFASVVCPRCRWHRGAGWVLQDPRCGPRRHGGDRRL